jgi:hypothetical protein
MFSSTLVTPFYGIVRIEGETYSVEMFSYPTYVPFLKSAVQVSPWMENGDAITFLQGHPNADRAQMIYDIASGLGEVLAILS